MILDTSYILNNFSCTGCHACFAICPQRAITMQVNNEGFLYPKIEVEKCTNCNLCKKNCPVLSVNKNNNTPPESIKTTKAYAAINKNETIRLNSSSGGIFTIMAENVIAEHGIVFGAKFTNNFSVIHSWTDNIDDLEDFRGSKYLQSIIGDSYNQCKVFLEQGFKVLFSGTPCQIQGLKKYLIAQNSHYNFGNLLTVDFICHGVPSPLLWQKYIDYRVKKNNSTYKEIVKTCFRRKDFGWNMFSLSFTFAKGIEYIATLEKDPYLQIFLQDTALRESCYNCKFRTIEHKSDITLADFWGINNILPEMDDDKGVSLVLIHSENGNKLLKNLHHKCIFKEIKIFDVIQFNPAIKISPKRPKKRDFFYSDLENINFEKIIKKYAYSPLLFRLYKTILKSSFKILKILVGKTTIKKIKYILRGRK